MLPGPENAKRLVKVLLKACFESNSHSKDTLTLSMSTISALVSMDARICIQNCQSKLE
jgi:hypothetical protein